MQSCKFFNTPAGCRKGDSCRFQHDSARPSAPWSNNHPPVAQGQAPLGVCRFYWAQGHCRFEFDCKYRHQTPPDVQPSSEISNARPAVVQPSPGIAHFLTEGGLKQLHDSGNDGFFPSHATAKSPTETHNLLKRFLYDDYRFRTTAEVYAFLTLIGNASTSNLSWTQQDGQLFLDTLATGNGILRLNDIIRWEQVSTVAGANREILSFQRGYVPLLRFLSSDILVKSTLNHRVNAIYSILLNDFDNFAEKISSCMDACITRKSFAEPGRQDALLGGQVFFSLATVLFECMTRIKNAPATAIQLIPTTQKLKQWSDSWIEALSSGTSSFEDSFQGASAQVRQFIINNLQTKIDRVVAIAHREQAWLDRSLHQRSSIPRTTSAHAALETALNLFYEGPGDLRPHGPRHDNDFRDIADIRIAPTHQELICDVSPYLPANIYGAPHHHPADSMPRLLDIQYRLLREELTAPIRTSIQLVREDLLSGIYGTALEPIMNKRGGKYRGALPNQETVLFNVYTNVNFLPFVTDRRGLSVGLTMDTPPGRARNPQPGSRVAFWKGMSSKRLMQGGLVALVWKRDMEINIHMGVVSSPLKELEDAARKSAEQIAVRVAFFDPAVELYVLNTVRYEQPNISDIKILVEAPVMFESIRPFLEALCVEPEIIPFSRYLVLQPPDTLQTLEIFPPRYSTIPGFRFQLKSLFDPDIGADGLMMNTSDSASVQAARTALKESRLDASQADAVIDALTREVALIQGPPGTGKSFTGVELLRVLVANEVRPVLLIAFTNHALDHLLSSVLDAKITKKIVRLGSRSADERISEFSLENLEQIAGQSRLDRSFAKNYRDLKMVEKEISSMMREFNRSGISSGDILEYIQIRYPGHYMDITNPPSWVSSIIESESEWQRVGHHPDDLDSPYNIWRDGVDLDFLRSPLPQSTVVDGNFDVSRNRFSALVAAEEVEDELECSNSDDEDEAPWKYHNNTIDQASHQPSTPAPNLPDRVNLTDFRDPAEFFGSHGLQGIPDLPRSNRPLETLLKEDAVWTFSQQERRCVHTYWEDQTRLHLQTTQLDEFQELRKRHREALQAYNEGKNEVRRQLLHDVDIVGCTTTGAAKLTSLLKGVSPRVLLVEEAGQVLETHVLGALVGCIEHMILIGDPLQLRPTLNNYNLSIDSRNGRNLYKFDMSLMERLSSSGLPMSQLNVQRRMRPTISNLIRSTLYPRLLDHELVKQYPNVRGLAKNIFFLSHEHREGGNEEDSVSKYNLFEVTMIRDLVLYLLRQGCYSQEGDIVVLCAYLGQLAKVRDALAAEVAVVIDDRDQQELADREAELTPLEAPLVEHVQVSRRVRLRTVDNYQGEEAKIVILSLVRNVGDGQDKGFGSIGYLKSDNRANVALSRAKHGLFILGNAMQMSSRSEMWRDVIEQLEDDDCVGPGIPVTCHQHPHNLEYVSKPGVLPRIAPDGGCLQPCEARLGCGHVCPYKCHPDDPNHVTVVCSQPCIKLCKRQHPCSRSCADDCGKCTFVIPSSVQLPCGHDHPRILCHQLDNLEAVSCDVLVSKALPNCRHQAELRCSQDPIDFRCTSVCSLPLSCCGRSCKAQCHECQGTNEGERTQHKAHPCERRLYCGHLCGKPCSADHTCTRMCSAPCLQQCIHSQCRQNCSTPCSPCQKPCTWSCPHFECPVPCGSVCIRLPCDRHCEQMLACGHRCPSVCGEDCTIQRCPICSPDAEKENIVDLVMGRLLGKIPVESNDPEDLLITLPKCRHTFTVETLDGHCGISEFYTRHNGRWSGLTTPDTARSGPPVCPTCRAAITSPRYGRVFKSADLDILEKNVISRMSQSIRRLQDQLAEVSSRDLEEKLVSHAGHAMKQDVKLSKKQRQMLKHARTLMLKENAELPVAPLALKPSNEKIYLISEDVTKRFETVTQTLFTSYIQVFKLAQTRSAHLHAWEAAFTSIFNTESDLVLAHPSRAPRNPVEYAMRIARMKVGQSEPRADKRFLVEAFWLSLQIRFILADLVQSFIKALQKAGRSSPSQVQMWGFFGDFLLETCERDAQKAYNIAQLSESRRQMTKTGLFILRSWFERFQFDLEMVRQIDYLKEQRENYANRASKGCQKAAEFITRVSQEHLTVLPKDKAEWITTNFKSKALLILDEWQKLEASIRRETFYEPVSREEMTAIVGAMNFSHTGHFYQCRNGHAFVITECGGAMERSVCPECGASIGGNNHQLDASNSRAAELEDIARQLGSAGSPWAWGRD